MILRTPNPNDTMYPNPNSQTEGELGREPKIQAKWGKFSNIMAGILTR